MDKTTRIRIIKDHIVIAESAHEQSGLVSFDGADNYIGTKAEAIKLAQTMREVFPKAKYTVYQITQIVES